MSVNPVNRLMLPNAGRADRSEAAVRSFNQYMKANLSSAYTYIDMYSYLNQQDTALPVIITEPVR